MHNWCPGGGFDECATFEMQEYYKQYVKENRGKIKVMGADPKFTSYSFEVETLPQKKGEEPKKYVVMKSWFANVGRDKV